MFSLLLQNPEIMQEIVWMILVALFIAYVFYVYIVWLTVFQDSVLDSARQTHPNREHSNSAIDKNIERLLCVCRYQPEDHNWAGDEGEAAAQEVSHAERQGTHILSFLPLISGYQQKILFFFPSFYYYFLEVH